MKSRRKGFTLIELLVVIAIIAILAAILFPVFAQAKTAAKKSVAVSNTKQISLALNMYNADYDDVMPTAFACTTPQNGGIGPAWDGCGNWGWSGTGPNAIPIDVQLQPYIKSYEMWHVPADGRSAEGIWWMGRFDGALYNQPQRSRSFAYVGQIRTNEWANNPASSAGGATFGDPNTGMSNTATNPRTAISATAMSEPASTVSVVEVWAASDSWPVGQFLGSTFGDCDTWKLAGRRPGRPTPGDTLPLGCENNNGDQNLNVPTKGYADDANYAFADGHAKAMKWGTIRANDFNMFKVNKPATLFTP